jgi:hypothetical protein
MRKKVTAFNVKKFDEIELLNGKKMVNYIQIDNNFMIIHFMDKSKTHCLRDEEIEVIRPKRTYIHRCYQSINWV